MLIRKVLARIHPPAKKSFFWSFAKEDGLVEGLVRQCNPRKVNPAALAGEDKKVRFARFLSERTGRLAAGRGAV